MAEDMNVSTQPALSSLLYNPLIPPAPSTCPRCGSRDFSDSQVLWDELVHSWALSTYEVGYINRQQGTHCSKCGSPLRVLALVKAIMQQYGLQPPFNHSVSLLSNLDVLEINKAGNLTSTLSTLPNHKLVEYPDVDMQQTPWDAETFDLIVHSDTLEHIPDPFQGLRECLRVLRKGGVLCFTVPIVLGRLSRSRQGLEPSYHGSGNTVASDFVVHSEFGSDTWALVLAAGFSSCTMTAFELPSAVAITARKEVNND